MSNKKQKGISKHHITYEPERVVLTFKGEHKILTMMQWFCRKKVSAGFIEALEAFIEKRKPEAIPLARAP